jgi:hypothetical protein
MHPDQAGDYEAIAHNEYADRAQSFRQRPGDRAIMRGVLKSETTVLAGGKEVITNYISVTEIDPLSRSPRKSVTVYEQGKHTNSGV